MAEEVANSLGMNSIFDRKTFWFDGNKAWGHYPKDWTNIKGNYSIRELRSARIYPGSVHEECLSFGFYSEHAGELTLGEFADKAGITL